MALWQCTSVHLVSYESVVSCINSDCEHQCQSNKAHSKQHVVDSVVYDETANHAVTVRVKYRPFISVTTCGWQSEQFQFLELVQKYQQ